MNPPLYCQLNKRCYTTLLIRYARAGESMWAKPEHFSKCMQIDGYSHPGPADRSTIRYDQKLHMGVGLLFTLLYGKWERLTIHRPTKIMWSFLHVHSLSLLICGISNCKWMWKIGPPQKETSNVSSPFQPNKPVVIYMRTSLNRGPHCIFHALSFRMLLQFSIGSKDMSVDQILLDSSNLVYSNSSVLMSYTCRIQMSKYLMVHLLRPLKNIRTRSVLFLN